MCGVYLPPRTVSPPELRQRTFIVRTKRKIKIKKPDWERESGAGKKF